MEHEFDVWMDERTSVARADFQKLLEENSFVEFWGKVRKTGRNVEGEDEDEDEAEKRGFAIKPGEEDLSMNLDAEGDVGGIGAEVEDEDKGKDLKSLANSIGEEEVERVLKVLLTLLILFKMARIDLLFS
jgi:transcription elongation regulator 1